MRISQREKTVLGYTHTSSSISQTSSSQYPDASPPHRISEIDFSDVFGGPPRRSGSFQDLQRRFHDEDKNDVSNGDGGDVLTGRMSGAGNPPVFGTEVHSRRRYPSEDFYNDIFGGDHLSSLSSSPRTSGGKNPFYSVPGSRVLSPTRPNILGVEPVGSPAQFSLPARLISTVQPSSTTYRPSPLSSNNLQEFSSRGAKATTTEVDGLQSDEESKRTSSVSNDHNQFHFSIYKWASKGVPLFLISKGVPLSMSLRSGGTRLKENNSINKLERSLSSNHSVEIDTLISEIQPENLKVDDDIIIPTEQVINASAGSKQDEGAPSVIFNDNVVARTQNSSTKAELKRTVNVDTNARHGKADRSLKLKESIRVVEEQMESYGDGRKVEKENNVRRNIKSKGGKVKEFAKIFNKDSSVKPKNHGRSIDVDSLKAENQGTAACWAKKQAFNVDGGSAGSFKDDGIHVSSGGDSVPETHQQDNLASTNGEVPHHTKKFSTNNDVIDESSISIEAIPEMDEITTESNEEHQILDSNVKKWSNGKEGNIRALLSTLQYVLWPNSGWKPVPLVDIIESSSVKRSYQRALLCLHPDKLQQKGAASDQKYIAARVFDVLQEAWDQFNSLGSL